MNGLLLSVVGFGLFLLGIKYVRTQGSTRCLDNNGNPVDWFIIYKANVGKTSPQTFYYMDATRKSWTYQEAIGKTFEYEDQAVGHTLNQIYHKKTDMVNNNVDFLFGMYNDQNLDKNPPKSYGHSKGVVAFDKTSGFWLIHSIPCFPTKNSWASGKYTGQGKCPTNAQTMLCISLDTVDYMDIIGWQLRHNNVFIYEKYAAQYFKNDDSFANMTAVLLDSKNARVKRKPCESSILLTSLGRNTFQSFAKCSQFGKDLYLDFVLPELQDDLFVQTWGPHKLPAGQNGLYWVYNILEVKITVPSPPTIPQRNLKYTQDHSKWAVTRSGSTSAWVCIGDINREKSQYTRGGGTVCIQDSTVGEVFYDMIGKHDHPGSASPTSTTPLPLPTYMARLALTTNNPHLYPAKRARP